MKTVKVGIVGCGYFGNFHLNNLQKIDGVEVVALSSFNSAKLKTTGEKVPGAHLYSSHREMFEKEKQLDALFICVPPDSHDDVEILAAKKGIHIYVEKPIGLSMHKAEDIESAVNAAGIISCVGYQERYNDEVEKIKDYISNKKIGLVNARWITGMPGIPWWRMKERSGGQIVEQCTHLIDMLRYLIGDINLVYSLAGKGLMQNIPEYNIDDYTSTILKFKSGVIASVVTACYLENNTNFNGISFQIVCNDTVIEYDWDKELRYITEDSIKKVEFNGSSHLKAAETFIEAIRTGRPEIIKSPYSDAVKTLRATLATNESITSAMPIIF